MAKLSNLLNKRLRPSKEKIDLIAQRSSDGELSGFSGIFRVAKLSVVEQEELRDILEEYRTQDQDALSEDLESLTSVTSEVKAIGNQAVILHGERIKRAQEVLKKYREGAFSTWLMMTYGNRQTPYNFLQYYDFYRSLNDQLKKQIDNMPRQVIYALASREGSEQQKERFVANYSGQTKKELLTLLRSQFPVNASDNRKKRPIEKIVQALENVIDQMKKMSFASNPDDIKEVHLLLDQIRILTLKK